MENCRTCGWCRFNEKWGDFRCLARETNIYIILDKEECEFYNEDKKKVQKMIDEKNARRSRNKQLL